METNVKHAVTFAAAVTGSKDVINMNANKSRLK
jgi:hypothetical protein